MADFLQDKKREIEARLKELRPLVDEFHRLEAAVQALDGVESTPARAAAPARKRRARSASPSGNGTGRRGRPRGTGTRSKEALTIVRQTPGITIPELAGKMGIKQNYL